MKAIALSMDVSALQGRLGKVLRAHRSLIAVIFVYLAAAVSAARYHGVAASIDFTTYIFLVPATILVVLLFFSFGYTFYVMVAVRPRRLVLYLTREISGRWLNLERLAAALVVIILLPLFFSVFTSWKALIPVVHPFAWDVAFFEWDRLLHGGIDPWQLLQPVLGFPLVTSALNFLYQCWLFIIYGMLVWQAFSVADHRLRMQFFISFVLVWALVGNLAAVLLSSAGPVYFARVTGLEDPYLPLMTYLSSAGEVMPVWALGIQEELWKAYALGDDMLGEGISAMPSMHVATAVLFALVTWRAHRKLGIVFTLYAAVVMIGSVHLAWHYALDGYIGALLAYGIWRAAGWWTALDSSLEQGSGTPHYG